MNGIPQITAEELHQRLESGEELVLIDVREADEVALGMISGAQHIPMGDIPYRMSDIPEDAEVVFICRSGSRSQRVCEYLSSQGYDRVANFSGGMIGWYELLEH
ncbi:rhodanese-like domain-containing protein [Paenibacillus sp. 7124]|uniref:Rhodanese-like domain-containing protein n=2 Tax=Paenibacillus TaxID=44249 RepID=A0A6M1PIH3_9BACL|nr:MULTISPECIES: rhodanese-like domain-containing protein [Paenibacillus]AHV97103.1 Rhodanese domain-containing protein [Paenibacillus sabinae T27]NGM83357.1 rhodanese-like domain-containing protein [Paenibacillus apii]NJJ39006.1 rhodanese-like domain-containing protein [Paenibacillus apii]